MLRTLFKILLFSSIIFLTSSHISPAFAQCTMTANYTDSHASTGCWPNNGCRQHSWGYLDVQCGAAGPETARVQQFSHNGGFCECPGGSIGVRNNLVILHNQTGDERYTKNGCQNGNSGIDIPTATNASSRDWICDGLGGHLEFTSTPMEDTTFNIDVVAGVTSCNWQADNGTTGSDDTTEDGICTLTYEMGSDSWYNGAVVWMIAAPPQLPCPIFNIDCAANGRSATISWTPDANANNYGMYVNYEPDLGCWVCQLDEIFGEEVRNNGIREDFWQWPLASNTTSRTIDTVPNASYGASVQATRTGETGSSSACVGQTFSCDAQIGQCGSTGCQVDSDCVSPLVCDTQREPNTCVIPVCESPATCMCTPNAPSCGDGNPDPGEDCDDGDEDNTDSCDTEGTTPNSNGACTDTFCGDGVQQDINGEEQVEECDDGNDDNNDNCNDSCQSQSRIAGHIYQGSGTYVAGPNNTTSCTGTPNSPTFNLDGITITIGGVGTVTTSNGGAFEKWVPTNNGEVISVDAPTTINTGAQTIQCRSGGSPHFVERDETDIRFFYLDSGAIPSTTSWYQTQGGLVYSGAALISEIPSGNFFSLKIANSLSAGIPWAAGITTFTPGNATERGTDPGNPDDNSPTQAVEGSGHEFSMDGYNTLVQLFDMTSASLLTSPITQPNTMYTCQIMDDGDGTRVCKTSGDTTIDLATALDVGDRKILLFVQDGNLTIENSASILKPMSVGDDGFLGIIVDGTITFAPEIGNGEPSSTEPNIEGVFVAENITIEGQSEGNDLKFVGEGIFTASQGTVTLGRDLTDLQYPAQLFIHRPAFIINMPAKMKTYSLQYQEVN